MPELPEVEVLARHLAPRLRGCRIGSVEVRKPRTVRPHDAGHLDQVLRGAVVLQVRRRAKYLLFDLRPSDRACHAAELLIGHLGMTGRMYLQPSGSPVPRHAAVVLHLDHDRTWIFEDVRGFGRLTFQAGLLERLGPEPLEAGFTPAALRAALAGSRQPIKVRLLDQGVVAGVGNIYASEALHRAGISPRRAAGRLSPPETEALQESIRSVLAEAIRLGSGLPLDFAGDGTADRLFYYGRAGDGPPDDPGVERFRVYDRKGQPCGRCGAPIRHLVQAARSTFYCPRCQR